MKTKVTIVLVVAALAFYASCTSDKENVTTPQSTCDSTGTISYSAKVEPILRTNCYTCHLSASTGGGIILGTYTANKSVAQGSRFLGAINQLSGYSAMPKNGGKLSVCDLTLIKKWIDAGCLNN